MLLTEEIGSSQQSLESESWNVLGSTASSRQPMPSHAGPCRLQCWTGVPVNITIEPRSSTRCGPLVQVATLHSCLIYIVILCITLHYTMLFTLNFLNGSFTLPTTAHPSLSFLYLSGIRSRAAPTAAKRLTSVLRAPTTLCNVDNVEWTSTVRKW